MMRELTASEYKVLYNHMKRDFPPDERPPYFAVKRNLERKTYDAVFMTDDQSGEMMGYAVISAPADYEYALLLYFAVLPEFRDKGIGGDFLWAICNRYAERTVVLEVEDPAASNDEEYRLTAERRIRFYERNGFFIHKTSQAKIFGVDMLIMANTADGLGSVREVMHTLYRPVFTSGKWLKNIDVVD